MGVSWGLKSDEMDVYLYQFSCAWLGVKCALKEKTDFTKNVLKSVI